MKSGILWNGWIVLLAVGFVGTAAGQTQPATAPATQPAAQPASQPATAPATQPTAPVTQPAAGPAVTPAVTEPAKQPSLPPTTPPVAPPSPPPATQPVAPPSPPPATQPVAPPSPPPAMQPVTPPPPPPVAPPATQSVAPPAPVTAPVPQPTVLGEPRPLVPMPRRPGVRPESRPPVGLPRVALEITWRNEPWGRIVIELEEEKAPQSVKNFLRYVDEGFYDGTVFHRVLPGFLIQGGGNSSLNEPKKAGLHEPVRNEADNGLKNVRGTIAMARAKDPQSARAQFFINVKDNPALDYPGHDGWGYCVFGRVVSGMEVVDRIRNVATRPNPQWPSESSQPTDPPVIKRVQRVGTEEQVRPSGLEARPPTGPEKPPPGEPGERVRPITPPPAPRPR